MNRSVRPSPPPSGAPDTGAAEAEESQIKVRAASSESALLRARMASAPEISPRDRLEAKLRLGRVLLSELSAADEHARLLSVALMRRDEALLDGVLAALGRRGL